MFFLRKVKLLGHIILAIRPSLVMLHIDEIKYLKTPDSTNGVLRILGAMGVYTNFVLNFYIDAHPFHELGFQLRRRARETMKNSERKSRTTYIFSYFKCELSLSYTR